LGLSLALLGANLLYLLLVVCVHFRIGGDRGVVQMPVVAAAITFAVVIWWVVRRGRDSEKAAA